MRHRTKASVPAGRTLYGPSSRHYDKERNETTCAYCGWGCGIRLSWEGDNWQLQGMSSIRPTAAPCASKGPACWRARRRLLYPRWMGQRIGWEEALDTLAERLPPSWPESEAGCHRHLSVRASSPPRITTSPTS